MKTLFIAAACGVLITGAAARADIGIDTRQADLQRQVDAGKRSGKLSVRERNILNAELRRIANVEADLRAQGNDLSEADERRIGAMLDAAQRHIRELKQNSERGRTGIHF